ncbi:Alpha/Beta hydrolase protein [Fusarium redolens]|uniref:Carboxylic ester hydrolase n=1 Tax=Fusarium redolens TaxID=48865 RepID=A0A9P9GS50_FUSRE|nr:Alpha/Beta hydrolase protein [Fusarium redolens]KAH7243725.1 Alpha/Beta hydrolase protein [Fusarium redolens]
MKPLTLSRLLLPIYVGAETPTATLDSGPIFGLTTTLPAASPVNKFLGIPYAAKPQRFSRAEKPEPWTRPLNATTFGPSCRQLFVESANFVELAPEIDLLKGLFNTASRESEDCLFINAFAPADPHPSRAVVLFISGGGWQQGNGEIDLSGFAAYENIVVFTFNYRTNAFGFPNSPDISTDEINLGIYDQQLAMEWVQRNARAFGGDPDKVTIWGESAGAMSVDIHVNRYTSPPFRAAMMFSGQMSVGYLGSTASHRDTSYWDNLTSVVGCQGPDQLQCMRDVPADTLINAMSKVGSAFLPITDNATILSGRAERWRDGDVARVPVLMGTVAEEGRGLINRNISLETFFGAYLSEPLANATQQKQILKAYDPSLKTNFDIAAAIYTDFVWQCPQAILANISASINPTWRFYFNASVTSLLDDRYSWLGKFHGSDVLLLFSSPTFDTMSPQLYTFAEYLRGVVGRFVRNPQAGPGWPVGSRYVANLGDVGQTQTSGPSIIDQTALDQRCSLYESIYPLIEDPNTTQSHCNVISRQSFVYVI